MKRCLLVTFPGVDENFGSMIQSTNLYDFLNLFYDVEYIFNYYNIDKPSEYSKFDIIMFGGDQVLQTHLYENHISKFLLPNIDKKILVFSSSVGYSDLSNHISYKYEYLIKKLKKIMPIALRERNEDLEKKFGLTNFHVCDPALLLEISEYEKMLEVYPTNKEKFTFAYYVSGNSPEFKNIDIVSKNSNGNINPLGLSIGQWLYLIKNAETIYTDSFHCYLFGTLYNKRVILTNTNKNNVNRMEYFKNYYQIKYDENRNIINYNDVIKKINKDRRDSILYLYKMIYNPIASYYSRSKNSYPSSSGGISKELARYIIQNNGCVYGVSWNDLFQAKHICIESMNDYYKINRSKYVQSELPKFKEIKDKLESGKLVMFTGTPCQIRSLQIYLNFKNYYNLLLVDLLCSSTFNPQKYKKIILDTLEKNNWKIEDVSEITHRWKEENKPYPNINIINNNKNHIQVFKNGYEFGKSKSINCSEICKNCPCGNSQQLKNVYYSDITIGDAWKYFRNNNCRWSIVLINTKRGMFYFQNILKNLYIEEINLNYFKSVTEN